MSLKPNILAGIIAGAGGNSITKSGLVFAATGGRIGYNSANPVQSGGTRYCFVVRAPIQITADVEFLELHWDNQYWAGNNLSNNGSARELVRYALEKFDGSAYAPILFDGGAENYVIPQGGHVSARIYPSALGLSKFTKGEKYFLRLKERVFSGGLHILSSYAAQVSSAVATGTRSQYYDEATESLNIYSTGTIAAQTGGFSTGAAHPFPQAIVGKPFINVASVIGNGDSIDWGFSDLSANVPQITGTGFYDRAVVDGSGNADICSMNAARPAGAASSMNVSLITQYYKYANILHHGHAVNDIGISGSPNLPAVYANMEALWATAREEGIKVILKRLLLPVTTTSSAWSNLAGQTINSRFASGSFGDQFEAQMQQYVTDGVIDMVYQIHTNVSDPSTRYAWISNGTNNYATNDGVHMQPASNILSAPSCRTAIQAASNLII